MVDIFLKNVGFNIKNIRKNKIKVSQNDLSIATGININTISNIENGKFPARLDTIYKIANYFKINPIEFFKTSPIDIGTINYITNIFNKISKMSEDEKRKFLMDYDT